MERGAAARRIKARCWDGGSSLLGVAKANDGGTRSLVPRVMAGPDRKLAPMSDLAWELPEIVPRILGAQVRGRSRVECTVSTTAAFDAGPLVR